MIDPSPRPEEPVEAPSDVGDIDEDAAAPFTISVPEADDRQQVLDRLVEEMRANDAFDGWSRRSVHASADMIDMDRGFADGLLADLPGDALAAASDWADRRMLAELVDRADALARLRLRQRVAEAVMTRFDVLDPYRDAVRRSFALLALPQNVTLGTRLMARTVDRIWHAVGDRSADFSYYTKRLSLAAAVTATTVYWLNGQAGDRERTADFLDRRIDGILSSGKMVARLERLGDLAEQPFRLAARLQKRMSG